MKLIDKSALVAEIDKLKGKVSDSSSYCNGWQHALRMLELSLDTLEMKDPYEKYIQYASIEDGIKAHAETYSFNIESELFNQLTKEQQALWRKEIERACISGGEVGVELARDIRYKENVETKEVDLEKEIKEVQREYKTIEEYEGYPCTMYANDIEWIARHFFELDIHV